MRFFGHHPQIVIGRVEAPYHQSGDDEYDMKSYLQLLSRVWRLESNRLKMEKLEKNKTRQVFMSKTANKGMGAIMEFIKENPNFIQFQYIRTWARTLRSITGE